VRSESVMKDQVTTLMEAVRQARAVLAHYVGVWPSQCGKESQRLAGYLGRQRGGQSYAAALSGRQPHPGS
jgi:hypothetical protein